MKNGGEILTESAGCPPVGAPGLLSQEASPYSCLPGDSSPLPGSAGLLEQTGNIKLLHRRMQEQFG